jgi:hypothetical protein
MPDDAISRYVEDFQRRYQDFQRYRHADRQGLKHDVITRAFHDHILLGSKTICERDLRAILTDTEQSQLRNDPEFTRAWCIFVDLFWLRKQLQRVGFIAGTMLVLLAGALFLVWALPQVMGPGQR